MTENKSTSTTPKVKKVKKTPEFRTARAVNAVIRSVGVIMRRSAPLSENQKKAVISRLEQAIGEAKVALSAPKGERAPRFSLPAE